MNIFQKITAGFVLYFLAFTAFAEQPVIEVFKSPSCQCCSHWEDHLRENGFKVISRMSNNLGAVKQHFNIPRNLASCHTGVINGYFIEGHVPAGDIKKLLAEKPAIRGLTVPGMPAGQNVPGMETRPGNDTYDVLAVGEEKVTVFNHYE